MKTKSLGNFTSVGKLKVNVEDLKKCLHAATPSADEEAASKNMKVEITGRLAPGVTAKDVVLAIIAETGTAASHVSDGKGTRAALTASAHVTRYRNQRSTENTCYRLA